MQMKAVSFLVCLAVSLIGGLLLYDTFGAKMPVPAGLSVDEHGNVMDVAITGPAASAGIEVGDTIVVDVESVPVQLRTAQWRKRGRVLSNEFVVEDFFDYVNTGRTYLYLKEYWGDRNNPDDMAEKLITARDVEITVESHEPGSDEAPGRSFALSLMGGPLDRYHLSFLRLVPYYRAHPFLTALVLALFMPTWLAIASFFRRLADSAAYSRYQRQLVTCGSCGWEGSRRRHGGTCPACGSDYLLFP